MELRTIEYFSTVASEGSMRGAAKKLGLSQPALTKAMRRLEDEIGVNLFDRRSHGVVLTVFGECFLRHARTLRAGMTEAASEIAALRDGTTGLVRIGAGPSWQSRVIPDAIRRFRDLRPGVRLQIVGGIDHALKAQLRAGALDMVVAAVPDHDDAPDLQSRRLRVDEYRVIADRSHPLHHAEDCSLADLLTYPWILPSPETYLVRRLGVLMRAHGLTPPQPMLETDIVSLKLELMRDSPYLSFHAVDQLASSGVPEIKPLALATATWQRVTGIIMRRGVEPNPAAALFVDIIEALCRENGDTAPPAHKSARPSTRRKAVA